MNTKKLFVALLILMAEGMALADPLPSLTEVRNQFYKSVESEKQAKDLHKKLDPKLNQLTPILLGYFGAAEALLAKHAFNPYKKLDYLSMSQKTMANAISQQPSNIELRFLRFSVQHYLPSFLGHSKNLEEDRNVMINQLEKKNYGPEDVTIIKNVVGFLLESKRCSEQQEKFLKNFVQTL